LNNDEYYDVHAVAGLLKLYLRELPTNVLTTERREEFVKVTALNELVHSLPIENFELLRALSGHLLRIVENSDVNKMTIRNGMLKSYIYAFVTFGALMFLLYSWYSVFSDTQHPRPGLLHVPPRVPPHLCTPRGAIPLGA
jgi:RalA-binding protein 1